MPYAPLRTTLPLFLLGLSLVGLPAHVRAATQQGRQLDVDIACLDRLHIGVGHDLKDRIETTGPWPAGIQATTSADGTIHLTRPTCPTKPETLDITTPSAMALSIRNAGNASMTLDDRTGPAAVRVGNGPARLGRAEELDVLSEGTGAITIPLLDTSARIHSTGSADVTIEKADAKALALYLGGSSSFVMQTGHVQALEITSASTRDAVFHGESAITALHVLGKGSILVDRATGTLATERDGPGKILVNTSAQP